MGRRPSGRVPGPRGGDAPLKVHFEELAHADTRMGPLSLRRRWDPTFEQDVFEVLLGDEYLMSSLFTVAEIELARLGLGAVEGDDLDVVVGGLGLGYTAQAVLDDPRVRSLTVIEAMPDVIDWHERGVLPDVAGMAADARSELVHADFFALVAEDTGLDPAAPDGTFDAILVDIDHSPRHVLDPSHASFYTAAGLRRLARHLRPDGVFALWSDDPPDDAFLLDLGRVFTNTDAHVVTFPNRYTGGESANTVYVAG